MKGRGRRLAALLNDLEQRGLLDQTLVIVDPAAPGQPVAVVPLMHRHEVEPSDAVNEAHMRHGSAPPLTPSLPCASSWLCAGASRTCRSRS